MNPNHLVALLVIAAPLVFGIALREPRLRVPALVALIPLNLAAIMSVSRSAIILVPLAELGVLVLGWVLGWSVRSSPAADAEYSSAPDRHRRPPGRDPERADRIGIRAVAIVATVATLAVAGSLVTTELDREYTNTREIELTAPIADARSKLAVLKDAVQVAIRHRWTGAGRGAFEQAYAQVSERPAFTTPGWAENGGPRTSTSRR